MYFKSERILVWSILFLMLIFIVRDILGVNINPYAITLLLSLIACSLSYKDLIAYSCFLLPNDILLYVTVQPFGKYTVKQQACLYV